MFLFLNNSPKLKKKKKIVKNYNFWAASNPNHKKLVTLLNLKYLVVLVAPNDPTLIWNPKL